MKLIILALLCSIQANAMDISQAKAIVDREIQSHGRTYQVLCTQVLVDSQNPAIVKACQILAND